MRDGNRFVGRVTAADATNVHHERIEADAVGSDTRMVPPSNPLRKTEFLPVQFEQY